MSQALLLIDSKNRTASLSPNGGSPDSGTILLAPEMFGSLFGGVTLVFEFYNGLFTPYNVSASYGNRIAVDDGQIISYVTVPDGSYELGGTGDIGAAVAQLLTTASKQGAGLTFTAVLDTVSSRYTISAVTKSGVAPFKLLLNIDGSINAQLGFEKTNYTVAASSFTGSRLPVLYDTYFNIDFTFGSARPVQPPPVRVPVPAEPIQSGAVQAGTKYVSLPIMIEADFGGLITVKGSQYPPLSISLPNIPSSITYSLTRPDGRALGQQTEWTILFSLRDTALRSVS